MPRNRNRNRQRFRTLTTIEESKYLPGERRLYNESFDACQKCGRSLEFYTYRTGQLCQICYRENINSQNQFQPPGALIYLPPRSNPADYSFESHEILNFQENDNFFNREKCAYPDTWQRRIYIKDDTDKPYESFNHYGNSHDNQQQPPLQRIISRRSLNGTRSPIPPYPTNSNYDLSNNSHDYQQQPPLQRIISHTSLNETRSPIPPYPTNSNYNLSNTPSTSFPIHHKGENKRKREPQEVSLKRMKITPYGSCSQFCQYDQLSNNIMEYFRDNIQTDEIFTKKMALRSKLQQIILRKFSGCSVFVFGSSMTGFATKTSDVDMSLMFHDVKVVKNRIVGILYDLRSLFSKHNNFAKMQVIRAKVAILKFRDSLSGFEVDLNINNPTGIRNSQLLRSYARLDDRVQPLILAVKYWAREHNINDAKSGTLSSYCLGLMLIHYLQWGCNPPVLPSLQVLQPDKFSPDSDICSLKLDEILPDFVSANNENVGQLFVGFLRYYSKEFNYGGKRISVRLGCLLPRVDKILTKEKILRHWIDIEEPFEQVNTARAVNIPKKAAYIKSVFDKSYNSVVQRGALGFI